MKLSGGTKKMLLKIKMENDVPKLESVKIVSLHCNLFNNKNQQISEVLFTFVPTYTDFTFVQFWHWITNAPHLLTLLNTANTEFSSIEVWFTDQNSKQLEIEDVNTTLLIE